ncbi:aspartate aminotransferase family protein [soil metagenome]
MSHSTRNQKRIEDRGRLSRLLARERTRYLEEHPRSRAAFQEARASLLGGVPMTWMNKWAGGFPVYLETARGAKVTDLDGKEYVDFCLGDTGAMTGHSPEATVRALNERFGELGGATVMLPTEDAAWVGRELGRRFGLPLWSFTLTATDANRWALRIARQVTRRPRILVFNYCYHGAVDETFLVLTPAGSGVRPGNVGPPADVTKTTRVVEFNDLDALDRELGLGDVAAVLAEPALTNIGIVLPAPGYHEGLRELNRKPGALLIIDETHTLSAGPGGCTGAWGLHPDIVTVGKSIGGGIPAGAYGVSQEVAGRITGDAAADLVDVGGVGGTLAGNALSVAAMRATLEHVLTAEAFSSMTERAARFTAGVEDVIHRSGVPWTIATLGARAEYRFAPTPPANGGQSAAAADDQLDEFMHLFAANRGVLMTPFHNMALMSPTTTDEDVDVHTEVFAAAVDELTGA